MRNHTSDRHVSCRPSEPPIENQLPVKWSTDTRRRRATLPLQLLWVGVKSIGRDLMRFIFLTRPIAASGGSRARTAECIASDITFHLRAPFHARLSLSLSSLLSDAGSCVFGFGHTAIVKCVKLIHPISPFHWKLALQWRCIQVRRASPMSFASCL